MHTVPITVNYYFTSQLLKPSCAAHVLLRDSVWFLIRVWWVMDDFGTDEVYYFHMTLYLPVVSCWVVKLFWYISLFLWGWSQAKRTHLTNLKLIQQFHIVKILHFLSLLFYSLSFSRESSLALPWPFVVVLFVMLIVDIGIIGVCTHRSLSLLSLTLV